MVHTWWPLNGKNRKKTIELYEIQEIVIQKKENGRFFLSSFTVCWYCVHYYPLVMLSLQLGVKMSIDKAVITTTTMFDMISTLDKHTPVFPLFKWQFAKY